MFKYDTKPIRKTEIAGKTHEVVLYDLIPMEFVSDNLYARNGLNSNAKGIAESFGCEFKIRKGRFSSTSNYFPDWLESHGVDIQTRECMVATLSGEELPKIVSAREKIHRTIGCRSLPKDISIEITRDYNHVN